MRVLILIGSLRGGGAESQVRSLADGLVRAGSKTTVALLNHRASHPESESFQIVHLRRENSSWLSACHRFRQLAKNSDVVYSFLDLANAFAALSLVGIKVPLIWGLRSSGVAQGAVSRGSFWLSRALSGLPVAAIVNAPVVREFYYRSGFSIHTWHLVLNGVDAQRFNSNAFAGQSDTVKGRKGGPAVGMIARADPLKRHDLFFQMVSILNSRFPQADWIIAGAGTDDRNGVIAKQMQAYGVASEVQPLGEVAEIAALIASLDVVVCCSDFEGSSNAILEALASAVPVVAFNSGDAEELLRDCGVVLNTRTAQALSEAVAELLNDSERRQKLGDAGRRKVVAHYSVERMADNTMQVLQGVLAQVQS